MPRTGARCTSVAALLVATALAGCTAFPSPSPPEGDSSPALLCDPCDVPLAAEPWHEQEPSVAIDPADPSRLLVAFRDDPGTVEAGLANARPGQNALGTARSSDRGATWERSRLPLQGSAELTSRWGLLCLLFDPIVAFGPAGVAHIAGGAVTCAGGSAVFVATSRDGGATWGEPTLVAQATPEAALDKPWLAVDPATGHLAATWTRFTLCPLFYTGVASCGAMELAVAVSTDAGATWSAPAHLDREFLPGTPANPGLAGHFSTPAWANGALHVAYRGCDRACLKVASSTDLGTSWQLREALPVAHTDGPEAAFTLHALDVDRSAGPRDGRLYLAYKSAPQGDYDLLLAWSDDAGRTWTEPFPLSAEPAGGRTHQLQPWMDVDDGGIVHAMYFDRALQGFEAQARVARWDPGTGEVQRLAVSAPWDTDPAATGTSHHGDYESIAAAGGIAVAAWTRAGPSRGGAPGSAAASFDLDVHVAIVRAGG